MEFFFQILEVKCYCTKTLFIVGKFESNEICSDEEKGIKDTKVWSMILIQS